ncbi:MAG: hypothetical protein ACP5E3_00630, partial [Bacteroidales bacterium]
ALSMVFITWYFFFRYSKYHRKSDLVMTFVFLFLGGALKITALLSFFALVGIFILEYIKRIRLNRQKLILHPKTFIFGAIFTIIPIASWIIYASYYNRIHDTTYFSTTLFPIWSLSGESIHSVLSNINEIWLKEYYSSFSLILVGSLLFINFIFSRKIPAFLIFVQLLLLIQVLLFILLQFWTLKDHDYYTINLFILPVFVLLGSIFLVKTLFPNPKVQWAFKLAFAVLIIFNIQYTGKRMDNRYEGWMNRNYQKMQGFYEITPYLREAGIQPDDKVISFSDFSHISLYLMNQKGWSRYTDARFNRENPIYYNQDSAGINRSLSNGAKYLVINGFEDLYKNDFLKAFTQHLKLTYKNLLIFEPGNPVENFKFHNRTTLSDAFCSAENIDSTGKYYIDTTNQHLFQYKESHSNEFSLSGSGSVALNSDQPYGMTYRVENLKHGESIEITAWKKGKDSPGVITVQAEDVRLFHRDGNEPTGKEKNGWYEMRMEIFIPFELENKEVKIFIYNPENELTYFDDLRIRRYESVVRN